jgi:hypothetical protein
MRFLKELQTTEKRLEKYRFCRAMGKNRSWATSMRDWHWTRILANLGIPEDAGGFQEEFKKDYAEIARAEIAEKRKVKA